MGENTALADLGGSRALIRYHTVAVKPEQRAAFTELSRRTFAQALRQELGLRALYAVSLAERPDEWRIVRIYTDEATDRRHAAAWQDYAQQSAAMVAARHDFRLYGNSLTAKGGLYFVRP